MRILTPANFKDKDAFVEALQEFKAAGEEDFFELKEYERRNGDIDELIQQWIDESDGKNLGDGRVPATMYWIMEDGKWLGRFWLRHRLNKALERFGGHLGYFLIPSMRNKGLGSWAMNEVLQRARDMGIERMLITCDEDNMASQKLIQKFGGVLQDVIDSPETGKPLMRWWIEL